MKGEKGYCPKLVQRDIREACKELGLRGWRFDIEGGDKFYLSKFDPINNDDEYRFYFFEKDDTYQVVRKIVIKKYKYKENVCDNCTYLSEAESILDTYFAKRTKMISA